MSLEVVSSICTESIADQGFSSHSEAASEGLLCSNHTVLKTHGVLSSNPADATSNRVISSSPTNPTSYDVISSNDIEPKLDEALLLSHPKSTSDVVTPSNRCESLLDEPVFPNTTKLIENEVVSLSYIEPKSDEEVSSLSNNPISDKAAFSSCTELNSDERASSKEVASSNCAKPIKDEAVVLSHIEPTSHGDVHSKLAKSTSCEGVTTNAVELASGKMVSSIHVKLPSYEVASDCVKPTFVEVASSYDAETTLIELVSLNNTEPALVKVVSSNDIELSSGEGVSLLPIKLQSDDVDSSSYAELKSCEEVSSIPDKSTSDEVVSSAFNKLASNEEISLHCAKITSKEEVSSGCAKLTSNEEVSSTLAKVVSSNFVKPPSGEVDSSNSLVTTSDEVVAPNTVQFLTTIHNLPNEVLEHIFTFLDIRQRIRTESVCKRWRFIGTEMLWSYPSQLRLGVYFFQLGNCRLNDDILCAILCRCGRTLKDFALSTYDSDLTLKSLLKIGQYCPNLLSIALHIDDTQNSCLRAVAVGCPNLKLVQVDSLEDYRYNEGISAIVQNCKSLESLYIANLQLTGDWLTVINPHLKNFNLNCCRVMPYALMNLIARCHALEELAFKKCTSIDANLLHETFDHFKNTLTVLRVVKHPQVVEWGRLISILTNLEALHLFGCSVVDDNVMRVIAESCSKLSVLDIGASAVTDEGLVALKGLPVLKRLNISNAHRIIGYGVEVLAAKGVLEQVTLFSAKDVLKEACSIIAVMYPNVRFVTE